MKVRVKSESNPVYYDDKLYTEGQEFIIKERKIEVNGKEKILSVEQQFSEIAMVKVEVDDVKPAQEVKEPANKPKPLGKPSKK